MSTQVPIRTEQLRSFCIEAMQRCGMRELDARTTADVLVTTDAWGVYSHGTLALRKYMDRVRAGGVDAQANPEVVTESEAWAIVDGHDALGMVTACRAMQVAIEKARNAGIAYVGVRGSTHFGAAG
jgi:ureidoglycolate dehydrogenase (NAD+)